MTSIILVPSPIASGQEDRIGRESYIPLGLLSLATILKADGWNVEIVDGSYLGSSPIDEVVANTILKNKPKIVGFSTMCNSYVTTVKMAHACKLVCPDVIVVFGGPQATMVSDATVAAFPFVDYVVNGEYEQHISSLIQALVRQKNLGNIPGITFRKGERIIQTPLSTEMTDLNQMPIPDYELYPALDLLDVLPIEAGRGCPFECSFCSASLFWRRKYRLRSTDCLIATLKELLKRYSIRNYAFEHDNLTASRKRVLELCSAIQHENLDIKWNCSARVDSLDAELVRQMATAGCNNIYLGIESGSPRIQQSIRKNIDLERVMETVRLLSDAGMKFTASFIMGFPDEDMSDLLKTVELMLSLRYAGKGDELIQLHLLTPAPGTLLYLNNWMNLRFDGHFSDFTLPKPSPEDLELILQYPDIFSAYYYFNTPNIERTKLLRIHHFLVSLNALPYTTYILWRDKRFRFPALFFERIDNLNIVANGQFDRTTIAHVSDFITETLHNSGLAGHFVQDVLAYEVAANLVSRSTEESSNMMVHRFEHNVEALINQISNREITTIPERLEHDDHSLLFIKKNGGLHTVRLDSHLARFF